MSDEPPTTANRMTHRQTLCSTSSRGTKNDEITREKKKPNSGIRALRARGGDGIRSEGVAERRYTGDLVVAGDMEGADGRRVNRGAWKQRRCEGAHPTPPEDSTPMMRKGHSRLFSSQMRL